MSIAEFENVFQFLVVSHHGAFGESVVHRVILGLNREQDPVPTPNLSMVEWDVSFWALPWKPRTVLLKNVQVCRNKLFK
jgi:hypothetical protein